MSAVCHRCGGAKDQPLGACPDCGFVPAGQDRLVAWLFGDGWLNEEERGEASRRLLAGERPDPSRALLQRARRALGGELEAGAGGEPLGRGPLLGLLLANVLLTPLAGVAVWLGMRSSSPRAARQVLWITAPVLGLGAALWLVMVGGPFV